MDIKEKYRQFCDDRVVPIYCQPWWLDATSGGPAHWDVALVEDGGRVYAAQPFRKGKIAMFTVVDSPPLTRITGPMIRYPEGQKQSSRVSFEKDVMTRLIEQLPAFDYFEQYFDYSVTNYLPYRWAGFKQQTYFSYILPDLSDVNAVFDGFRSNIKTDIRKAEQSVSVEDVDDLDRFYALLCMSYGRQQRKPAVSIDLLRRIDEACKARGQRSIFIAIDAEGRPHAGAYIVWDERSAYYLLGGGDPQLRNSGATSLVLWHAIRFCAERTVRFDFEGSVYEPIERYFRAFGGVQTSYHKIYKENAFLLKLRSFVRGR